MLLTRGSVPRVRVRPLDANLGLVVSKVVSKGEGHGFSPSGQLLRN
jgi:hypothetical protein